MQPSISEELNRAFDLASLRHTVNKLHTPADLEKGNEIMSRHKKNANEQEALYRQNYGTRINKVMKQLIDKAGSKERHFTRRFFGVDQFDKDVLQRKAHRIVQHDHLRRMSHLAENESNELDSLITKIEQREQLRDGTKQEFKRATNRRSGQERRNQPTRNR